MDHDRSINSFGLINSKWLPIQFNMVYNQVIKQPVIFWLIFNVSNEGEKSDANGNIIFNIVTSLFGIYLGSTKFLRLFGTKNHIPLEHRKCVIYVCAFGVGAE